MLRWHVLLSPIMVGLVASTLCGQIQQGTTPQQSPAAQVGLPTFGQLGQQNQPRSQPTSAFTDILSRPVTTDVFAGRSDPRAAQAQGGSGTGGATAFQRSAQSGFFGARVPTGLRAGGRFGAFGRNLGSGFGRANLLANRPSFVVRAVQVVAGLTPPPSIRRYGATPPRRAVPPVTATVARIGGIRSVEVTIENGVAVLRGVAESEEARRLATLIVKLEPGVRQVRNEMRVVRSTGSTATGTTP